MTKTKPYSVWWSEVTGKPYKGMVTFDQTLLKGFWSKPVPAAVNQTPKVGVVVTGSPSVKGNEQKGVIRCIFFFQWIRRLKLSKNIGSEKEKTDQCTCMRIGI